MDCTFFFRFNARRLALAALLALVCTSAWARHPTVEAVRTALQGPDAEAAASAGDRAVAARPKDAEAWYYAGQAYGWMAMEANILRKAGWAGKTHEAFQKAATLDPDHLGAREGLVQFYTMAPGIMGGGKDKADAEIADFAKRNPAGGHYLRAMTLEGAAAERELRTALRLAPGEVRYRRALVGLLDRAERVPETLAAIEAGLSRFPDDARLLYMLGRHAALHGVRLDAGKAALDRIVAKTAASLEEISMTGALWRRGQLLEKRGQLREALADYRRSAALDPDFKDVREDIARLAGRDK